MEPQQSEEPFFELDEDDQSAVLAIVTITSMLVTGLVMACRLLYRCSIRVLRDYDFLLLGGTFLLLAQSVLLVQAASLGIGKHAASLDESVVDKISKLQYAITLLGLVIAHCAKLCMCLFIRAINPYTSIQWTNKILMVVLGMLFLSSFLANALRCPLPTPWRAASRETCPAALPVYCFTVVSIMLTDVIIVVLAVSMVARVQTGLSTKILIFALFSSRLLVVGTLGLAITKTYYSFNSHDTDFTWDSLDPMVWSTVSSHLSVITACIPELKGIFDTWLGNTFSVGVDAPYQLERVAGKSGFTVSARPPQSESGYANYCHYKSFNSRLAKISNDNQSAERPSRTAAFFASSAAALKLTTSSPNQPAVAKQGEGHQTSEHQRKKDDDQNESVKELTDGGMMIHNDVEVKYEDFDPRDYSSYSSQDSKH